MLQSRVLVIASLLILIQDAIGIKESSGDQDHGSLGGGSGQSGLFANFFDFALDHLLGNLISNGLINITADMTLLSIVSLKALENISIIGHSNPTVNCDNAGGIYFDNCYNCSVIGITWEKCGNKTDSKPAIELYNSSNIIIQNCSFQLSQTEVIALSEMSGDVSINGCKFAFNNHFEGNGTAVHYLSKSKHHSKFQLIISNCNFTKNGASNDTSIVYIGPSSSKIMEQIYFTHNIFLFNQGTPIYISYQEIIISGFVMFKGNKMNNGGGMYIDNYSTIIFQKLEIQFINNIAMSYGGALCIKNSNIISNATTITADGNKARFGGALSIWDYSNVTFKGNSTVTISNNQADDDGGALYIDRSYVTFEGNSAVTISNNQADYFGGALFIRYYSYVAFEGNSTVTISNNQADYFSGALFIWYYSYVTFEGNSIVTISNNQADDDGGALCIWHYSNVTFEGNSTVTISNNQADDDGGALYIGRSYVTFEGNSTVTISNNQADDDGGALYIERSYVTFEGNSTVTISNNQADNGGALSIWDYSNVTFEGNSVTISNNQADNGGALYVWHYSNVTFQGNTKVIICDNRAYDGGALYASSDTVILFQARSKVKFNDNKALRDGGALYAVRDSIILFQARSTVKFDKNIAFGNGGALFSFKILFYNCTITFNRNEAFQGGAIIIPFLVFGQSSAVQFTSNKATLGGALHVSNITFKQNTAIRLENNAAIINGGAIYSDNSSITAKQNSVVIFTNNSAENGGAVFASVSTLLVSEYSNVTFNYNIAGQNGGAIYFNDQINASFDSSSTVTWTSNTANNHGGAIYSKITQNTKYFNINEISGSNDNTAGVAGNFLYIDLPKSCNTSCLTDRIVRVSNQILYQGPLDKNIATSPKILELNKTVKCISNKSAQCENYYINNIMLGQEIIIYPCLLDHYNKPAEVTQFRIIGENNQNYFLHGSEYASISCNNAIEGISIVGNKIISGIPLNYSIYFTSYATVREVISTNLLVELSPCHPGFQYQSKSECHSKGEVVSCSGSSSTIKRGYWFGYVTGIPTVTFCPITYCNFTCCKATNGYYHLSPMRTNQCRQHRDGTACGNCVKGYTILLNV